MKLYRSIVRKIDGYWWMCRPDGTRIQLFATWAEAYKDAYQYAGYRRGLYPRDPWVDKLIGQRRG